MNLLEIVKGQVLIEDQDDYLTNTTIEQFQSDLNNLVKDVLKQVCEPEKVEEEFKQLTE